MANIYVNIELRAVHQPLFLPLSLSLSLFFSHKSHQNLSLKNSNDVIWRKIKFWKNPGWRLSHHHAILYFFFFKVLSYLFDKIFFQLTFCSDLYHTLLHNHPHNHTHFHTNTDRQTQTRINKHSYIAMYQESFMKKTV